MKCEVSVVLPREAAPGADKPGIFQELLEDIPAKRRLAALLAGSDTRFPVTGTGPHPLAGFLVPDFPLHTSEGEVSIAGFLHAARPVLGHV